MAKKMCKLIKEDFHNEESDAYIELIKKPKFYCKKCGRVADDEDRLCKAKKIK